VVDDEPDIRLLYRSAFERLGVDVAVAVDGDRALEVARAWQPDVVILDLQMPGRSGESALPEFAAVSPASAVIVVSAHLQVDQFGRMQDLGAKECFEKLDFLNVIPGLVARYGVAA
jgi:DNA-binding NtrC family response regulator